MEANYKNVKYGMLVEVLHEDGYHAGCKIHFFNKKGVLVGNYYEFVPYEKIRLREPHKPEDAKKWKTTVSRDYQRFFYGKPLERVRNWLFIRLCNVITSLLRYTETVID